MELVKRKFYIFSQKKLIEVEHDTSCGKKQVVCSCILRLAAEKCSVTDVKFCQILINVYIN